MQYKLMHVVSSITEESSFKLKSMRSQSFN